jgi:hypothetical protein
MAVTAEKQETVKQVIFDSMSLPENFCIIEGASRNQVRDFADMGQEEIMKNIDSRKNRVFIMLEEVRRLNVQMELNKRKAEDPVPPQREYKSVVPGFPRITENTIQDYYIYWSVAVISMLVFARNPKPYTLNPKPQTLNPKP